MSKRTAWAFFGIVLWSLGACSQGDTSVDDISAGRKLVGHQYASTSSTITVQMALPSTLSNASFLVAQNLVQIDSRVTVNGQVWSGGTVSMQPDAQVQSVISTGNVFLADRDTIGTVTTGGKVIPGNGDTLGQVTRTSLSNLSVSNSVTFPPATQSVPVNAGQTVPISPGAYTSVTVNSGGTLVLAAGDYYFSSLVLEWSSTLRVNPAQGATRVFIAGSLVYRGSILNGGDASRLFVESLGTTPVVLEAAFQGSIVVPRASLTLGTANRQAHRGSFMAQTIEVQPDAKLEFVPFNPAGTTSACAVGTWDRDGNPFTPCVAKTSCVPGRYVLDDGSTTSDRTCAACASGQFSATTNAASCQAWQICAAGTYVTNTPSATVDRTCVACSADHFSNSSNAAACTAWQDCQPGSYVSTPGTAVSDRACAACPSGQTTTEINATSCVPQGIPMSTSRVLHMQMDEAIWSGLSGEVVDSSGNGNSGVSQGAVTTPDGKFDRAGLFSAGTSVLVQDSSSLRASGALTMAAWFNSTDSDLNNAQGIIAKRRGWSWDSAYTMFLWYGRLYVDIQTENDRVTSNATFATNQWYHVVVVFDGSLPTNERVRIYVNGVLDTTAPESSTSIEPYTSDLFVGLLPQGGQSFLGRIDEASVWTRALSASEVATLYTSQSPL